MKPSRIFRFIQNAEQFSFRRARPTHVPYHIASRLDLPIFQMISKIQLKVCLFNPLNEAELIWCGAIRSSWYIDPIGTMVPQAKNRR
jgi:hypothetical protein